MDKGGCFALALFVIVIIIAMIFTMQGGNSGALNLDQSGLAVVDHALVHCRVWLCLVCGLAGQSSALPALLAQ